MTELRIHQSAQQQTLDDALVEALRARRVDNRFHYVGDLSARRWQALASSHSPAQDDSDGRRAYDDATRWVVDALPAGPVHVIGVACGDGVKERHLLQALADAGRGPLTATPVDVSEPLLTAAAESMGRVPGVRIPSLVACDLGSVGDLPALAGPRRPGARVVTLYGVLSTLGPQYVTTARTLLAPEDLILVSANLLPGRRGARDEVMAQYDNVPTRAWLRTVLAEVGVPDDAGALMFGWERDTDGMVIVGDVLLSRDVEARLGGSVVPMSVGERVRVLESHRHTAEGLVEVLAARGLRAHHVAISPSGEEAVACARMT